LGKAATWRFLPGKSIRENTRSLEFGSRDLSVFRGSSLFMGKKHETNWDTAKVVIIAVEQARDAQQPFASGRLV
jgi:hypothetical protein